MSLNKGQKRLFVVDASPYPLPPALHGRTTPHTRVRFLVHMPSLYSSVISTFVLSVAYEDWLSHKGHVPVLLEAPHPDLASEAQVKVCEGRQLCLCLRLQGDSFLGRYPRSLQLSGHPSELHWLPLNLSKQRSVNLDAHAELTAALPTSPETIHSSWKGLKLVIGANPRSPATGRHAQGRPVPFRWARPPSTLKPDYPLGKELLRNWRGL